jgi:hypothetical protein
MCFRNDLEFGKQYEKKLVEFLGATEYIQSEGKVKEWDLKITQNGKQTVYEVKADRMMYRTNNFCIEYESYGNPSGIISTTAEYYAYFEVGTKYLYIIPVSVIKKAIVDVKYTRKLSGGDRWNNRFYLFPKQVFMEYRKEFNETHGSNNTRITPQA